MIEKQKKQKKKNKKKTPFSNVGYLDVLSHLSVPGQDVVSRDRKAYLCFDTRSLLEIDWEIPAEWKGSGDWEGRNLCVQQKIRTSVGVNRRSDDGMGAAVTRRARKATDSSFGLSGLHIFAPPVPSLTTGRPTDVRVPCGFYLNLRCRTAAKKTADNKRKVCYTVFNKNNIQYKQPLKGVGDSVGEALHDHPRHLFQAQPLRQ